MRCYAERLRIPQSWLSPKAQGTAAKSEKIKSYVCYKCGGRKEAGVMSETGVFTCFDCLGLPRRNAPDTVNHPKHYTSHPSGIQPIEITRHMNFNLGNAMKYLFRAGVKTPDPLEDLKKARWYLDDEIKRLEESKKS